MRPSGAALARQRLPLTGGCLCGHLRYELRDAPLTLYICHCADCQRHSGSAFGMSMPCPRIAFELECGSAARWERLGDGGASSTTVFCPTCSTRLYSERGRRGAVNLRPGTLDDTSWLVPVAQLFTHSAQPWGRCLLDQNYETQPPQSDPLVRAWQEAVAE